MGKKVYLKCIGNVETKGTQVLLQDVGEVWCSDKAMVERLKKLLIHRFGQQEYGRVVISSLRLIQQMEEAENGIEVEALGETDILLERIRVRNEKGIGEVCKVLLVCLVSFCGTLFTIMAYHNDIGINRLFETIYTLLMGRKPVGINPLEISYSIGVTAGILVFFNHIGKRRITKDPTPIEVAMRGYEYDVDKTLIDTAIREGLEEEVQWKE